MHLQLQRLGVSIVLCHLFFCTPTLKFWQYGPSIDPALAHEIIRDHNGTIRFVIIDVRTKEEFASAHLAHAKNIDYNKPDFDSLVHHLDTSATYLVYCTHGIRGFMAVEKMRKAGCRKSFNLEGGIKSWTANKYPVESGPDHQ
jgi:rhodanese-related sulfurtransferase